MLDKIYRFILDYFVEHGSSPSYTDLTKTTNLSPSNIGRYIRMLVDKGLLEIYSPTDDFRKGLIFPKGLREKVQKIIKEEYVDKLSR